MMRYLQSLDVRCFLAIQRTFQAPSLRLAAQATSHTGDGWLYPVIMPVSIVLLQAPDSLRLMAMAALGFALERLLYLLSKNTLRRRRPPEAIADYTAQIKASDRFSLPSGHTSAAFFVATFLSTGVSPLFLPLFGWALAIGLSRVILGVHFLGDILMGALLGLVCAQLIL